MAKKKAAFIGAGAITREHLHAMQFIDEIEVAAVCDLSPARAEAMAERFHVPRYFTNHTEMLQTVAPDMVHIATPPAPHFALSKQCLDMGLNVLCEKPLTLSLAEFETLRGIAEKNSCLLLENQNYRRHSSVRRIADMVAKGELGEVIEAGVEVNLDIHGKGSPYMDANVPHFTTTMKGGVVSDFLTHFAYLMQMFVGTGMELASVWTAHHKDAPQADEFRALIKAERGIAQMSFSGNAKPPGFWLRVVGTKGRAEANLFEGPRLSVRRARGGAAPIATVKDGLAEARSIASGAVRGLYRKFSGLARYDGLEMYLRDVYAAIDDRSKAPVTLDELAATTALIEKLLSSEGRL